MRVKHEASLTVVVGVPAAEKEYEAHAKRVQRLLDQAGYVAVPMTAQHILDMAKDIQEQIRETEQANSLIDHAVQTSDPIESKE